jgi:hypothetical protein
MEQVMNHSKPNGEYPELNWSGFRIPSKRLFDGLVSGLLVGLLISNRTFGGALAFFAVLMIWKSLEFRLDRIEAKLSN